MIKLAYEPYGHQIESIEKMTPLPGFFDMSSPGTGKTLVELIDFANRRNNGGGRAVVFAPKSILQAAWGDEIDKATAGMTYGIAMAGNREAPFKDKKLDIVLTNHDALKSVQNYEWTKLGFDTMIIDESTAVKNPSTQRFKAAKKIAQQMKWLRVLSGTPRTNTIMDLWSQTFLLDRGARLGDSYWKFRNTACEAVQNGPLPQHVEWRDKPGIELAVFDLLADISIRHKLEDVIDMPERVITKLEVELQRAAKKAYDALVKDSTAELSTGVFVDAVHAAALMQKLLQTASGAVYTRDGEYATLDDNRTEMVMDLLDGRAHSLVLFQWQHQRDELMKAATKRGYAFEVVDGKYNKEPHQRAAVVKKFQAGELKVIFAHPKSAGHGLTLTKGTTTIWVSPTWSSELFEQANARIYRNGQTERTEFILISAKGTVEEEVYERLGEKLSASEMLMALMEDA